MAHGFQLYKARLWDTSDPLHFMVGKLVAKSFLALG